MSRSTDLVTEFLETLTALSTGSYLREEEREFWEPPYPPEVVTEAAEILRRMGAETRQHPEQLPLTVVAAYGALVALSERHGDAVFEDEEVADFRRIVTALAEEHDRDSTEVLDDLDRIIEQQE